MRARIHPPFSSLGILTVGVLLLSWPVTSPVAALHPDPDHSATAAEFPDALVKFSPSSENPVFTGQGDGHWDAKIRERGWILVEDGVYRMWYTGYRSNGPMKLGYATSSDGLHWQRHARNPIYDAHWVEDMMVVRHGGTYYMFAEGLEDRAQLLTSPDGLQWTRQGQLDIRRTDGQPIAPGPFGTPTAWWDDGTWYLLYERRDRGIWLATSDDLQQWIHVQDEPVLRPGPGEYDRLLIAANQVIQFDGRYYLYYHGRGEAPDRWTTNIAVSGDLVHWEKYPGNPLFPAEENKSSGILVRSDAGFRLYTMHDQVRVHFPETLLDAKP